MSITILNTLDFFSFLSIACHLICDTKIINGQCHLFEGSIQYERFNRIFLKIVGHSKYRQIFIALGMPPEDFGPNYIRKGAVIYFATGCTTCTPIASISFVPIGNARCDESLHQIRECSQPIYGRLCIWAFKDEHRIFNKPRIF